MSSKRGLVATIEYSKLEAATNNFSEDITLGGGVLHEFTKLALIWGFLQQLRNWMEASRNRREWTSHGLASVLTWHMRMKIAIDVARGLEYLHETYFRLWVFAIHGGKQNKSSAQLSDAPGIASLENVIDEKITEKSDVYAFGIILLELLTGRKPFLEATPLQCQSIVAWAMPNLTHRSKLPDILDARIQDTMDPKHLCQVAAVAVLCVQPEPNYRPLITDVLHSLTPLVPIELGGTLSIAPTADKNCSEERNMDSERRCSEEFVFLDDK
ncbi:hypothetical protein HPP92_008870 [Vanilla planifolia]|uniref:Protein kinase domain-containing protein n=1 Tax=Vanilla planifolia TaxID=51239 RepID=A0A835R385_VANPL|nr:hypothetical protein HPP92_008870 [Vanilla planifolia]